MPVRRAGFNRSFVQAFNRESRVFGEFFWANYRRILTAGQNRQKLYRFFTVQASFLGGKNFSALTSFN
jgi:hypothetical protein